jgi:hypothetical protein
MHWMGQSLVNMESEFVSQQGQNPSSVSRPALEPIQLCTQLVPYSLEAEATRLRNWTSQYCVVEIKNVSVSVFTSLAPS